MEISHVKFEDEKQYKAVKRIVNTFQIENINPTFERVQGLKDLIDGNITPDDIKRKYNGIQKV